MFFKIVFLGVEFFFFVNVEFFRENLLYKVINVGYCYFEVKY